MRLIPVLAALLLTILFGSLGVWQLHRAGEKAALEDRLAARRTGPVMRIGAGLADAEALRFYKVQLRGRYLPRYQFFVSNKIYHHRLGYHVLTPFKIEGGETVVLIDRGWVPKESEAVQAAPRVETPPDLLTLQGTVYVPQHNVFIAAAPPAEGRWPAIWPEADIQAFSARVPFRVQPFLIQLDPGHGPGGFVRDWRRPSLRPEKNRSYAFQWFSMALAVWVTYFIVTRRRRRNDENRAGNGDSDEAKR